MGRQAYAIGGGIIGAGIAFFATGGTATLQGYEAGFALGAAVGGVAGSYIDPIVLQGNKVGDSQFQVAAEGGARAMMFGRCCVTATCIIARGNRVVHKNKTSNGKGSSGSTVNETVTWTFAIALGEAIPSGSITRIWQDETLVYDVREDSSMSAADNVAFSKKFRFYDGSETQLPDADLQTFLGADTPYFRGTAYTVFPNFDLTQTAERIPTFRFEVVQADAGVVDIHGTLDVSTPASSSISRDSDFLQLTGDFHKTLNLRLKISGKVTTRNYAFRTSIVGGNGHFIIADGEGGDPEDLAAFYIDVDTHAAFANHRYYLNANRDGEASAIVIEPDGTATYTFDVDCPADSKITLTGDNNGVNFGFVQTMHAELEITGNAGAGDDSTVALSAVVGTLLDRAGMDGGDYDTSALTDLLAGVCIEQTTNGDAAVNSIVQPYFADPCERDGVLRFVKRGGAVLRTLTIDDLTEIPDVPSRENVVEYPAKLSFFYQSPQTAYAQTKATSSRYSEQALSSGEGSVTAPVTFDDADQPAQIAAKLHKVMWTEAEGSFIWTTAMPCIDLVPTDVLGLSLRGIVNRARIIGTEFDGSTVKLTMIKDRQSSYTSNVTAIPLPPSTPPLPATVSTAVLAVMDIPALTDNDDALIYYTAMSGATQAWNGGQLQRSLDNGITWTTIGDVSSDSTMGRLTATMTAADAAYTDTTNHVVVQLFDPRNDLLAQSDTTFLQEQGAIAIEQYDGTWEILQYRDAVDGGNGLWTLSYLQRGRLDTVAGPHSIGALFVLLDSTVARNSAEASWLGATIKHRAVSYGTSMEDAGVISTVFVGNSQREWSPASATYVFDGVKLSFDEVVPRWRFGSEVTPIPSINFVGYRAIASDGTNSVSYDFPIGNDPGADVSSLGTLTSVQIAETNRLTGAGAYTEATETSIGFELREDGGFELREDGGFELRNGT